MPPELPSTLDELLKSEPLIRLGCAALGIFFPKVAYFAYDRWFRPHPHPEIARKKFRRKARRLVIWAFLAGRQPGLWFWLLFIFQRASIRHALVKVRELTDPADPPFALRLAGPASHSLQCENDEEYVAAVAGVVRELQVLEQFKIRIPDNMSRLRFLIGEWSNELARCNQEIYERLMSQHGELAWDELHRSPIDIKDVLENVLREEIKSLRRRLRCLGRKLIRILEASRKDLGCLVQAQQPQTDVPLESPMATWIRPVFICAVLSFLVLAGLQIATLVLLGR